MLERFLEPNLTQAAGLPDYIYAHDDPFDQCDPTGLGLGCPAQQGTLYPGAPYNPSAFHIQHSLLAQIISLLALGLGGAIGGGVEEGLTSNEASASNGIVTTPDGSLATSEGMVAATENAANNMALVTENAFSETAR